MRAKEYARIAISVRFRGSRTVSAAVDYARDELRQMFGNCIDTLLDGAPAFITQWGRDPLVLEAYSYLAPGATLPAGY
jgi:hypothetical protein